MLICWWIVQTLVGQMNPISTLILVYTVPIKLNDIYRGRGVQSLATATLNFGALYFKPQSHNKKNRLGQNACFCCLFWLLLFSPLSPSGQCLNRFCRRNMDAETLKYRLHWSSTQASWWCQVIEESKEGAGTNTRCSQRASRRLPCTGTLLKEGYDRKSK